MAKKYFFLVGIISVVLLQSWFFYVTFFYSFFGIQLQMNAQHQWIIHGFQIEKTKTVAGLEIGDVITRVDGKDPHESMLLQKWGALERSKSIDVSRNGEIFSVSSDILGQISLDYYTLFGEILCLFIALLIYLKIPHLKSAKFLSLVFFIVGIIFMTIPASSRNDSLGKLLIASLIVMLPLVFLHFLSIFLKEKSNVHVPHKYLYYLYGLIL